MAADFYQIFNILTGKRWYQELGEAKGKNNCFFVVANVEFPWNPGDLSIQVEESASWRPRWLLLPQRWPLRPMAEWVLAKQLDQQVLKCAGEAGVSKVCDLFEAIISEGCIPLTLYLLVSSAGSFCNQFGPRSGAISG